jgi:hypothetical protein
MVDCTACTNRACPQRVGCFRFRMVYGTRWQSVSQFPTPEPGESCAYFLPIEANDPVVSVEEAEAR